MKTSSRKKSDPKPIGQKSIVINNAAGAEGGEETEVAAQITIPNEGVLSWIVLAASFTILIVIDGCSFSYGPLLPDIVKTMKIETSLAALVNAIEIAIYFLFSPIAAALINRFGFRTVTMTGSVLSSMGLFASYFCNSFISLLLFLGILTGVGISLISMASCLIVGFYFEKRRSFALAAVSGGSSVGVMTIYPLNVELVRKSGWKNTILIHAGMHGLVYFICLTFRPLLSLTVTQTEEEGNPARTVTFLPTISADPGTKEGLQPTATERMLRAVSNKNFPTAAAFFQEGTVASSTQEGPSSSTKPAVVSRITLQAQGTVNKSQLKQMQSMVSRIQMQETKTTSNRTEITVQTEEHKKRSWWGRLLNWQSDSPESRPMYRDDAFYQGQVEKLPVYQKSVAAIKEEERTGLEYQLAVSRAIRVNDLQERRGVCTIALRRVIATMMDPSLLKKKSFLLYCLSGFLSYSGVLVPYVFLEARNEQAGIDSTHCAMFISVLSFANLGGRIFFSILSSKIEPIYIYCFGLLITGISTILSDISFSVSYQYGYCIVFGFFISVLSGLRSIIIVNLYGLENLTNATGVALMFVGFGNLISTPLAGALKNKFGFRIAFYVAGGFITAGGIVCLPVKTLREYENIQENKQKKPKK